MSDLVSQPHLAPGVLERIELAFPDLVGAFEVHERDLELDGRPIANWLAYSQGRVMLVSAVDGSSDEAVLRALDGLAFARSQPEMLADSIPGLAAAAGEVCVVLVAVDGFAGPQLERLQAIDADELWLLCRRELRTQRGTHTRLEALELGERAGESPGAEIPDWAVEGPFRAFLARIAPDRLALAISLVERMRLLDPQLEWSDRQRALVCALSGTELCRLTWIDGHLELVFDEDRPSLAIRDAAGIERVIEALLGVYLQVLSASDELAQPRTRALPERSIPVRPPAVPEDPLAEAPEPAPLPALDDDEELDDLDDDDLEQIEMRPMPPGPLLSREEIQAFQE